MRPAKLLVLVASFQKSPSVGSIAGAVLVRRHLAIGLAIGELQSDPRDLMQTQMAA
jgi:hypothetical protein